MSSQGTPLSRPSQDALPFGRQNGVIFIAGLAVIALGYLFLSIEPATGFASLTLAPLLLVIGYCVLIPWAILYKAPTASPDDG